MTRTTPIQCQHTGTRDCFNSECTVTSCQKRVQDQAEREVKYSAQRQHDELRYNYRPEEDRHLTLEEWLKKREERSAAYRKKWDWPSDDEE